MKFVVVIVILQLMLTCSQFSAGQPQDEGGEQTVQGKSSITIVYYRSTIESKRREESTRHGCKWVLKRTWLQYVPLDSICPQFELFFAMTIKSRHLFLV